jgi:hypothetical protein
MWEDNLSGNNLELKIVSLQRLINRLESQDKYSMLASISGLLV